MVLIYVLYEHNCTLVFEKKKKFIWKSNVYAQKSEFMQVVGPGKSVYTNPYEFGLNNESNV